MNRPADADVPAPVVWPHARDEDRELVTAIDADGVHELVAEMRLVTTASGEARVIQGRTTIGTSGLANVRLESTTASRLHCEISVERGRARIRDLGSRNGTFVNGAAVVGEARRLQDADQIVLAGVLTLVYHDPGETVEGPRVGRLQGVWLDQTARTAWVDARPVEPELSAAQFALLWLLYERVGQVVTRDEIVRAVWPEADPAGVSEEAIDGLIKRLRSRLRATQPEHEYIEVLRGQGLRLKAE